jgi:tetratricopeptide (TPR) repeat protein
MIALPRSLVANPPHTHTRTQKSFSHIDSAMQLEPTEPDFYMCRARLFKHAGDYASALESMDKARKMDLGDRYLNNKTIKYALRAGKPELALSLANLFVRKEEKSSTLVMAELHEMQVMWFEYECGASALRRGNVIEALKQFACIEKHFDQFDEDMYDFHEFSLRKIQLRSYVALFRNDDKIRRAPVFRKMAHLALEALYRVMDEDAGKSDLAKQVKLELAAKKAAVEDADESKFAGMTPTERKLAKAKLKKERLAQAAEAQAKQEQEEAAAAALESSTETSNANQPHASEVAMLVAQQQDRPKKKQDLTVDPDPQGFRRFERVVQDPLKFAQQLVDHLLANCDTDYKTHVAAFDLAMRKKQIEPALTALERIADLSGEDGYESVSRLYAFGYFALSGSCGWRVFTGEALSNKKGAPAAPSKFELTEYQKERLLRIFPLTTPEAVVSKCRDMIATHGNGWVRLAAAQALVYMGKHREFEREIGAGMAVRPLALALLARETMMDRYISPEAGEAHLQACVKAWPMAGSKLFTGKRLPGG